MKPLASEINNQCILNVNCDLKTVNACGHDHCYGYCKVIVTVTIMVTVMVILIIMIIVKVMLVMLGILVMLIIDPHHC